MYSRTSSDTLKLRRLITSLRDTGSDLAVQLENQSQSFFTGVQIVRSNNANTVRFDSDDESDYNEFNKHAELQRIKEERDADEKERKLKEEREAYEKARRLKEAEDEKKENKS